MKLTKHEFSDLCICLNEIQIPGSNTRDVKAKKPLRIAVGQIN